MNRDEAKRIIQIMVATYPNYKPNDLSNTVDIWHMMLEDYSYGEIAAALKAYISTDTSGFAPSVGQVIDKLHTLKTTAQGNNLTESEAWSMVYKAICKANYYAEEEFAKLPPLVQKAVGTPAQLRMWANDPEFNVGVASSNFNRVYRNCMEREKELAKLPTDVRVCLGVNNDSIKELEDKING